MGREPNVGAPADPGAESPAASITGGFIFSSDAPVSPQGLSGGRGSNAGQGWTCRVLSPHGELEIEQLDHAGHEWSASGPGGDVMGGLSDVLLGACGPAIDRAWVTKVVEAIGRDHGSHQRTALLVTQVTGTRFHATFSENRASIRQWGLDYRRMTGPGIAGSATPEAAGVFLTSDLEGAQWFARMGRRGPVDIWAVALVDAWLIGDPGAGGGGDDSWMIIDEPVSADQLTLIEKDITDSLWST